MIGKLEDIERKFREIERELSSPDVFADKDRYAKLTKRHAELSDIVSAFDAYKQIRTQLEENNGMLKDSDAEIRELAAMEQEELRQRFQDIETRLQSLLTPKDPLDSKNIILEIRAGTGGEEAALFAADLFRMYSRYAEIMGWKVELMDANETGSGGFKEVVAAISGKRVYSRLKFESGTHRVQRVPSTESQGRVHTSAVTVAVLPEAEEVEVEIRQEDLRIDVYRASGPGGQCVNTTDSAVRITHIPTGLVVTCQDQKSQIKNKAKAMTVLRARLFQQAQEAQQDEYNSQRKSQVGSGDRSERIRTYNFPQGRVTDHRINLTLYNLDHVMQGNLDGVFDPLIQHYQTQAMQQDVQA
ncbi:peptide chain release factor 1 [Desulfoplanes sp.]